MNVAQIKKLYAKKDKMHNFKHILRIKKNVLKSRKGYDKINEELLEFLIYYHGLKEFVLKNNDFDRKFIISLIRHTKKPKLIEEKIVCDANNLDNVGKVGIKKALAVGKLLKRDVNGTKEFVRNNLGKIKFYTKYGNKIGKLELEIIKKWSEN